MILSTQHEPFFGGGFFFRESQILCRLLYGFQGFDTLVFKQKTPVAK